ncbi:bifunctional PIG-L family deacetylase/class I SAM-dependent methyltransferase [Arthrobacter sp. AL08]|uniref:bifunctional PIG-L family deacetylase/class I SAM-dependent methyltransferase n=1 Tax=unclassified Arthrobacter TaxID=235627 RepID=UPI001D000F28|nr:MULTISPECIES: bifunctional PIG-L family deacetylase/class I SAM-dependent methyltransferase [unclassified Arthrobacter]MCB5282038.1 1D-myo-inositol 2-acetamido-2-deoxy-alpha-D-glucopyranoside deacetylase [Arthrobacter sp. ES1]MDI3241006.1 bifunctional PIG-L family deacetylase/class I SAM-dependent methyltransferase [Arthrobacter sp. AL05]MDI3277018.1 bifunctional PIG-L family deacetylase/class I SAM-dependent methyltransferase [Arthrobacter sp. AL08]WGZ79635.1 bifunctional PIG-L family deace
MVSFTHQDAGTSEAAWAASGLVARPELLLEPGEGAGRVVIVLAAHPDDESLGAGGLMARLERLGARVTVLLCTAGESSHPDSPSTTPEQLAGVRLKEFGGALERLLPEPEWRFLGLPDGRLADHREELRAALQRAIAEATAASGLPPAGITLVAPYRHDGHTDHEELGAAAAEAANAGGHGLLEYPIWYWLWADATDPAWQSWLRLPLDPAEQRAKAAAMAAHSSQVQALSGQPGDEALLSPAFLGHFERPFETFAWQRPTGATGAYAAADAEGVFDAVHTETDDPWEYTTSWYEQRKRSLTLAALPGEVYTAGLEVGCSIGTLSAELAQRCTTFLAVDASSAALAHAARRLDHLPAARTRQLTVPREWPDGRFDLIVVSEVGYYLAAGELAGLFARVEAALLPGGSLVLCHWRHPISGWELDGDAVHAAARRQLGWSDAGLYRERDFILEVLTAPLETAVVPGPEG